MTEQERVDWLKNDRLNIFVKDQFHHHHSSSILNTHLDFKNTFLKSLDDEIAVKATIRKTSKKKVTHYSRGINANDLNLQIRNLLKKIPHNTIKFEVIEDNGVFYFSAEKTSIGGFDFAVLNQTNNLLALRNLCFGSLQYADGEKRWRRFLSKNPELNHLAKQFEQKGKAGQNIQLDLSDCESAPLIVGEIQFGNWALAYRDFFKVLKADVQNNVDCLIYIVPSGNLEQLLSKGVVTFDNTKKILETFAKVISVPVWLIGLDVD